jgi:hypothetical protein
VIYVRTLLQFVGGSQRRQPGHLFFKILCASMVIFHPHELMFCIRHIGLAIAASFIIKSWKMFEKNLEWLRKRTLA